MVSSPQPSAPLAHSALHDRKAVLEDRHQWLLKQIKRKRTELNNFVEQMRSVATEIFGRSAPAVQKMAEIDREIHGYFKEILTTRKLGKQTRKDIRSIYRNLQEAGLISYRLDDEEDEMSLDDLFSTPDGEERDREFGSNRPPFDEFWEGEESSRQDSENNAEDSRKIRQTFLRLAEIFHPDLVRDDDTRMNHTEIMKEINRAYKEGDLARLLEIEKQHQAGETIEGSGEGLTRQCQILEQQNELLATQYENLKRELRQVKRTPEGAMVSDYRKAKKHGFDLVSTLLKQVDASVKVAEEVRDFVRDFHQQKMTIKDFLKGPEVLRRKSMDMMEKLLEELLEEIIIDIR
ncbi:MAG: molecular chaperone DnaJ [Limnospira sp.]